MQQTFQITISGQVQGVGFRPFVYGIAHQFQYNGSVCNNGGGVLIHINSDEEKAREFLKEILKSAPKISIIQSHSISEVFFLEYDDFRIVPSQINNQINIPLTPDFAICESCKTEIRDTNNRRFGYAFTTCTNCGPRYSVTMKFPFERVNTTLSAFDMCTRCQTEYANPNDRRFHSQTNSCVDCGIELKLTKADGKTIGASQCEIIKKVSEFIVEGNIVALKNTNGYLLCCDANNKAAIERLREKKRRQAKPFALLYPSIEHIKKDFELSAIEKKALTSSVSPIVVLNPKNTIAELEQESIAQELHHLGVMLPSSALLVLLMDELKIPIIATSGNIHGSPIISKEAVAVQKLSEVADYFLHHNLDVSFPQDDSVVRFAGEQQIVLRRSRGLAPNYLSATPSKSKKILAMGSHLKSTFSFVPNAHTYVSPYFGNLDNYDVLERYQKSIVTYEQLFETQPEVILIDSHPQYQILGIVWDGTGFGEDQAIWGGEFFNYEKHKMKRLSHFEYVDWIAADKMAKEPRLSLLSMLSDSERETVKHKFSETEWKIYNKMLEGNDLKTSSVGRLFDAVASLLQIIDKTSYEGEAAMLLENQARSYQGDVFADFLADLEYENIPTKRLIAALQKAKNEGVSVPQIASSFIHTLALVILKIAKQHDYGTIACSGGVFQNSVLVEKLSQLSQKRGMKLKFNRILSSNDENISFGQLCYYQHIKN